MNDIKKIGLTALAGSLLTLSAQAGELTVSGGAKITYTGDSGNEDASDDGNRFGMQNLVEFSGSGELDNGMTVSLYHNLELQDDADNSTSTLSLDMGDMGTLTYGQGSFNAGIATIDDMLPTADEEVSNGIQTSTNEYGTSYEVDQGGNAFNYNYSQGMFSVDLGWSPSGTNQANDDGDNGGSDGDGDDTSVAVKITPMDGLMIYGGLGEITKGNKTDDHSTIGLTYSMGPVSVGVQRSEIDFGAANAAGGYDSERTGASIAFAVNENLSISYGQIDTELDGQANDEELKGFSIGYSMGGITIKAHQNKGEHLDGDAQNESEHTEVAVSFAF